MKPGYGLIESMFADAGRAPLLYRHLERLEASASELGVPLDDHIIGMKLADAFRGVMAPSKVRLVIDPDGETAVDVAPLSAVPDDPVAIFANIRFDSHDPLLRHKTTRRKVYDMERARLADVAGGFDVIFLNERGEVCEGAITNVFAWMGSEVVTPPVECGLLPGIMRAQAIERYRAVERVLTPENLRAADRVVLTNAVRGEIPVTVDFDFE